MSHYSDSDITHFESELRRRRDMVLATIAQRLHQSGNTDEMALKNYFSDVREQAGADVLGDIDEALSRLRARGASANFGNNRTEPALAHCGAGPVANPAVPMPRRRRRHYPVTRCPARSPSPVRGRPPTLPWQSRPIAPRQPADAVPTPV